jgi:hypothetical protein
VKRILNSTYRFSIPLQLVGDGAMPAGHADDRGNSRAFTDLVGCFPLAQLAIFHDSGKAVFDGRNSE